MLFVRCMPAWRAPPSPVPSPISRSIAALSMEPKSAAGGKSTTRKIEPRGGGATPISRSAASALPQLSAGDRSVTHSSVEVSPVAFRNFAFGAAPSIRTTAFPFASWPVTTRLVGCTIPSVDEKLQAASGRKRNFRSACDIAAAFRAERRHEIREDVVAGPVTPGAPEGLDSGVFHPADAAHDRVDVGHFEGDVIEHGIVRLRVGDRVVDAVAAHEIHEPGAIGDAKTEHLHREARAGFPVPRIEDDVRHLQGPVAVRAQLLHAFSFGDEAEHVALGAFDEIPGSAAGFVEVTQGAEPRPRRS